MKRSLVIMLNLAIILIGMLSFSVQTVQAQGTITIRADGSIDPVSASISTSDNVRYVFMGDIEVEGGIVVERNSIMLDGAGYTLSGTGVGNGIDLGGRINVLIFNLTIRGFNDGILLKGSSYCRIIGNNIRENLDDGIDIETSSIMNTISGNIIEANQEDGINIDSSDLNHIIGNDIRFNQEDGIDLDSSNNYIYHNNFVGNTQQAKSTDSHSNWFRPYVDGGGNYWSDYSGVDMFSGPYQDVSGSDGIGDTLYQITVDKNDSYPLMDEYDLSQIEIPQPLIRNNLFLLTTENVYYVGDQVVISGSLTQQTDGAPISGVTLRIGYHRHKDDQTKNVITDSNGEYQTEFDTSDSNPGTAHIKGIWMGNSTHLEVIAEKSITIKDLTLGIFRCFIATATYGSELSPEVQFLRNFRENTVYNTFAGSSFMKVFNGFYYSFSPSVASVIADNSPLRDIMKGVLYPLIGILHVSSTVFSVFSINSELAIVLSGLVASALIGFFYLTPPLIIVLRITRTKKHMQKCLKFLSIVLVSSLVLILSAELISSGILMMCASGILVLVTMGLSSLGTSHQIIKRLESRDCELFLS